MPICSLRDQGISVYRTFLESLGGYFSEPFEDVFGTIGRNYFETVSQPFVEVKDRVSKHHNNRNSYKDNHNHYHRKDGPVWVHIEEMAIERGWPILSSKAAKSYLDELPGLTAEEC